MRAFLLALMCCVVLLEPAHVASAADTAVFEGDWAGAADVGGTKLPMVIHLTRSGDKWSGTMDSPAQNSFGNPISKVEVKGSTLYFAMPEINLDYEGTLAKDGTIVGTCEQNGTSLALNFARSDAGTSKGTAAPQAASAATPSPFAGDWAGALDVGGQKLRLVFHFTQSGGAWSGTVDSVDQGANGIPIGTVTVDGAKIHCDLPMIKGGYEGTLSDDGSQITGTWSQGATSLPLNLARGDASSMKGPNRPQEPKPPLPYDSEDVTYTNPRANVTLAGTLTKPRGAGQFPVVLLISGSGPQDRDESVMTHRPFLVLSDYLTRNGLAVLRVDDRGIGKSTGSFQGSTTGDFADDALAGVEYLKSRKDIDASRIGLAGHSEGGIIAPIVAAKSKDVAFVVLLAAPGVPADEVMMRQGGLIMKANGATDEMVKDNQDAQRQMFDIVRTEKDPTVAETKLRAVGDALMTKLAAVDPTMAEAGKASIDASVQMVNSPWFRYWLSLDPAATLRGVKQPVLALNGSLDLQVDPKQNLPAIEKALREGGNKDVTVDELAGLNHLFQTATTGSPTEYASIEETMSPVAMKKMSDWIAARTAAKKK